MSTKVVILLGIAGALISATFAATQGHSKNQVLVDDAELSKFNHVYKNVNQDENQMLKLEKLITKVLNGSLALLEEARESTALDKEVETGLEQIASFKDAIRKGGDQLLKTLKDSSLCETRYGYSLRDIRTFTPPQPSFDLAQIFHGMF